MGVDFAKAALEAGHAVVASGRDSDRVSKALGQSNDLLAVTLDVTNRADAEAAVLAALDTIVNPGFFRTELLTEQSTNYAKPSIHDYDEGRAKQLEFWSAQKWEAIRRPREASASPHQNC